LVLAAIAIAAGAQNDNHDPPIPDVRPLPASPYPLTAPPTEYALKDVEIFFVYGRDSISIYGDGEARRRGTSGSYDFNAPRDELRKLLKLIYDIRFFELEKETRTCVRVDQEGQVKVSPCVVDIDRVVRLSVQVGEFQKSVFGYPSNPVGLRALHTAIRELADE
jgi:hypothetical protein